LWLNCLGDKYEGEWYQSYKHGQGTDYSADGSERTGQYNFGNPVHDINQSQQEMQPLQSQTPDIPRIDYGNKLNEYASRSNIHMRNPSLPLTNNMKFEQKNFMDEQRKSFIEMKNNSSDFNSADYEYSGYETQQSDQNDALIKQYNKILAKRFPNSNSEGTSVQNTPMRNVIRKQNKDKYTFHIPAHMKSRSKEFMAPQNRDGCKYNLEVLSKGKYKIKDTDNYKKLTKRRLLHSLQEKLSPPRSKILNPRHASNASKLKYIKENHSLNYRSDSLSGLSKKSTQAISKHPSKSKLSRIQKLDNNFGSNRDMHMNNSLDEASYGRSSMNSYNNRQRHQEREDNHIADMRFSRPKQPVWNESQKITSRQILQRLQNH